jgi:hypothetical protein
MKGVKAWTLDPEHTRQAAQEREIRHAYNGRKASQGTIRKGFNSYTVYA